MLPRLFSVSALACLLASPVDPPPDAEAKKAFDQALESRRQGLRAWFIGGLVNSPSPLAPLVTAWKAGDFAIALGVGYPDPNQHGLARTCSDPGHPSPRDLR